VTGRTLSSIVNGFPGGSTDNSRSQVVERLLSLRAKRLLNNGVLWPNLAQYHDLTSAFSKFQPSRPVGVGGEGDPESTGRH
jgi:hypothetical protein